ncbi:hypothetical protein [Actinoplanes sp. NPDC026623]|uniref:hypothetical protein n=1 Tax=Actinoplanes sp. NPDC026623 TaxID=3155610 RepID=UPI003400C5E2
MTMRSREERPAGGNRGYSGTPVLIGASATVFVLLGAWLFVLVTVPGVGLLLRRVMRSRSPVPDGSDGRSRA